MTRESLNSKKILEKIEEKKKDIKKYNVKKIGLFGSYVKNTELKNQLKEILALEQNRQ